jgi:hypothetical protein
MFYRHPGSNQTGLPLRSGRRNQLKLLDLIETYRAEAADPKVLFGGAGQRVRGAHRNPAALLEATRIVKGAFETRRGALLLQEALTTSDFPALFGDIIDRQMLGLYNETTPTYTNYCKVATVPDFRTVKRLFVDGSEAVLGSVAQRGEYPMSKLTDGSYTYAVQKYGRRLPIDWESMVNDDLDGLKTAPARFAKAARRSEEKFATGLFVDANGPHASLYTTGNKNKVNTTNGATSTNPALSAQALQDAITVMLSQTDAEGEPIEYDAMELVVPPSLEVTAQNILHATQIFAGGFGQTPVGTSGGNASQTLQTENWLKNRFRLSTNYYIPRIATSANANTSWFLFASASAGRPAIEIGFLKGHESPELFMKTPNSVRVGGGSVDPMDGDFDNDTIEYKVRHVFGGTRLDFRATVASNGSGA